MNLRRVARVALAAPLLITGGMLFLTLGSADVFAASGTGVPASTASHTRAAATMPISSSKPHEHEEVDCSPGKVAEKDGQCRATFTEAKPTGERDQRGQRVCFSVSPKSAGHVQTGDGNCATTNGGGKAFGTFMASGNYCGNAVITATETAEDEQTHHTTVTIACKEDATTTAFAIAAVPQGGSPAVGLILGLLGAAAALASAVAVRVLFTRRRLAARQSA